MNNAFYVTYFTFTYYFVVFHVSAQQYYFSIIDTFNQYFTFVFIFIF